MGDQPVTKADLEGSKKAITAAITTALTAFTNQMTLLMTEIRNANNNRNQQRGREGEGVEVNANLQGGREGRRVEVNENQQGRNNQVAAFPNLVRNAGERDGEREPLQVRQGGNNSSSEEDSEEEAVEEAVDQRNQQGKNNPAVVEPARIQQGESNRVELCNEVVQEGNSVLIFCSSRKGCESSARHVSKLIKKVPIDIDGENNEFTDIRSAIDALRRSPSGVDPVLEETLPSGVAYHHAGLTVEEREIVETCYRKGLVRVLTATSTLAAGVNLPARRVIFRQPMIGRDFIDGTRYKQLAGRAGRTGIETKGESVLICKPGELKRIMALLNETCPPLQSCLSEDKNGMTHAILEVVGELAEDGYLHDFPPMRDKAYEIFIQKITRGRVLWKWRRLMQEHYEISRKSN